MIKNYIKRNYPFLVGVGILVSIILVYIITNDSYQIFNYDMAEQGVRFVQRGWDLFNEPGIEFWDWNHYLGSSVFVHIYYFLFSPFWLIFAILPNKESILKAFLYVNMFKHIALFITSALYFKSIRKTNLSILVGASIITFSGFALGYYNYSHYTDALIFIPLILLFTEKYLKEGKYIGLVVSVALATIIDVYLLIIFFVFIFLYALFRYIDINENINIKSLLNAAFRFVLLFMLGLLIASFSLIPNIEILLSTSRISVGTDFFETISKFDLFRYITGILQPVVDRNNYNPLISKYVIESFGHSGGAAVYSLIITPLIWSQIFFLRKKSRNLLLIFYTILFSVSIFPSLYFFMQGNQDTRWMAMFIFLNAYTVSLLLDDLEKINIPMLTVSAFIVGISEVLAYIISRQKMLQDIEIYYDIAKRNIIIICVFICFYFLSFILKNKKITVVILITIIIAESYFSIYNIFFNPIPSIAIPSDQMDSYQINNTKIIDSIKNYDDGDYRIDAIEDYAFNNPMGKNYMGLTFYSSVYNYNIDQFIQGTIASAGGWVVGGNPSKWAYKEMFGAKYWFDTTGLFTAPFGYEKKFTVRYTETQSVDVYENRYSIPLIYTMDNAVSYDTWTDLNVYTRMNSLLSNVVLEESTNQDLVTIDHVNKLETFGEEVNYQFEDVTSEVWIIVEFPRSEEVLLSTFLDGVKQEDFWTYEPQYAQFYLTKEFDSIYVKVTNLYGVPEEEFINTLSIDYPNEYIDGWYSSFIDNSFSNVELGINKFSAIIDENTNRYAVTSIAYDKYWKIEVNGENVETFKVNGGFIGFEIPHGKLRITAEYVPISFYIGVSLSLLTIAFFLSFVYLEKIKLNKREHL